MASTPAKTATASPFHTLILLRERDILANLRKAFAERYLPEQLFYWLPSSVQAWVDLCQSKEYKNASRALEVLNLAAPEIAQRCSDSGTLCGIGCGEGGKDRILLEAFSRGGHRLNFVAADFSQTLLELAIDQAWDSIVSATGVKLDIFSDSHLEQTSRLAHTNSPVLFTVLGNTLGAFDAQRFPARLRRLCNEEDRFLFDGEIFNENTLGGYDNPTNRRFAWGPLNGVGITEYDGRLEFSTEPIGNGLFAVTKHFLPTLPLQITVGSDQIEIPAGEKLRMSSSIKYRNDQTLVKMAEAGGFKVEGKWMSKDGNFVLAYARPA